MADILNRFCQKRNLKPEFEFSEVIVGNSLRKSTWAKCRLTVPGVNLVGEASKPSQNEAKQGAIRNFCDQINAGAFNQAAAKEERQETANVTTAAAKPGWAIPSKASPDIPNASGPAWAIRSNASLGDNSLDSKPMDTKPAWAIDAVPTPPGKKHKTENSASTSCLEVGNVVMVHGLQAAPELNGQEGLLLGFSEQTGRWEVALQSGTKALKPLNLRNAPKKSTAPHRQPSVTADVDAEASEKTKAKHQQSGSQPLLAVVGEKTMERKDSTEQQNAKSAVYAESQVQSILDHLRNGRVRKALGIMKTQLKGMNQVIPIKQYAAMLTAIPLMTAPAAALAFINEACTSNLCTFSTQQGGSYFKRFARWAVMEFFADIEQSLKQAQESPAHVLEKNGSCAQQIQIKKGKGAAELEMSGDFPPGFFSKGDWILLTSSGKSAPGEGSLEAEITKGSAIDHGIMINVAVKCRDAMQDYVGRACRVDRIGNRVVFVRQIQSLKELVEPQKGEYPLWLQQVILAGDESDNLTDEPTECEMDPRFPGPSLPESSPHLAKLNPSQCTALTAAFDRRLTLIQGPPGTGKTTTSAVLIRLWVSCHRAPILVAAASNIAVDNLLSACAKFGLNVVRLGRPEATRPDLERYNIAEIARSSGSSEKAAVMKADVVCCTCSGAGQATLDGVCFGSIVIDEVAQATELTTLAPLLKLDLYGSVVLVGDHRQLPATVLSHEASKQGLSRSLFERLDAAGVEPFMLDTQFRMHPAIARFPAVHYYSGLLKSGVPGSARQPLHGIVWPSQNVPICFLNVDGKEAAEGGQGSSYTNGEEVEAVSQILGRALKGGDAVTTEIGVVTPYAGQARLIRQRLGNNKGIEVSSVDGFQGREKDLILVSCVRANASGNVGFAGDERRLNVMLTRARRGLVVCGNFNTLYQDSKGWRPWLDWTLQNGLVMGRPPTCTTSAESIRELHHLSAKELLVK